VAISARRLCWYADDRRLDDDLHRSAAEVGDRVSGLSELSAVSDVCLGLFGKLPDAVCGIS
jgi:hypothetical protein